MPYLTVMPIKENNKIQSQHNNRDKDASEGKGERESQRGEIGKIDRESRAGVLGEILQGKLSIPNLDFNKKTPAMQNKKSI